MLEAILRFSYYIFLLLNLRHQAVSAKKVARLAAEASSRWSCPYVHPHTMGFGSRQSLYHSNMSSHRRPSVDSASSADSRFIPCADPHSDARRLPRFLQSHLVRICWKTSGRTLRVEMDFLRSSRRYRSAPREVARVNRHGKSIRGRS
jgi:hypothetical protein